MLLLASWRNGWFAAELCVNAMHPRHQVSSLLQVRAEEEALRCAHADQLASESALADCLSAGETEQLAVQLHAMLQCYPSVRERWLCGESMQSLLDERKLGTLPACCSRYN